MFSQANLKKNSDCSVEPVGEDMIGRSDSPAEQVASWREAGLEALGRGEVGVVLLAGGQGTRLGSDRPKALYDVGLPSKKTLLELQAGRIRKLEDLAKGRISWYVIASPATVGWRKTRSRSSVRELFLVSLKRGTSSSKTAASSPPTQMVMEASIKLSRMRISWMT